jgi:hypothetical protein
MPDIENHTIRLLQELREEMRQNFARSETNFTRLEAKINDGFEHLSEEIEEVRRAFAGPLHSILADESVDFHQLVPRRLEPFGSAAAYLSTARFQNAMHGAFQRAASVRFDLDDERRPVRRAR